MGMKVLAATAAAVFAYCVPALLVPAAADAAQKGIASYYKSGKRTANGERFNPMGLTAAHRSLPFGTKVRVTQVKSGRSVVVRINDRGPFIGGRIIDLALGAAQVIGLNHSGVAKVEVEVLSMGSGRVQQALAVVGAPVRRTSKSPRRTRVAYNFNNQRQDSSR